MTQRELSQRLEVDSTYLSHLEADRKEPSLALLKSFAAIVDVPPSVLLATAMWVDLPEQERARFQPVLQMLLDITANDQDDEAV